MTDAPDSPRPMNFYEAVKMIEAELPGWWWRIGSCHLTDDAAIGPDYNHPQHGGRLLRQFPIEQFDGGFDVVVPANGDPTDAIMKAYELAKAHIANPTIPRSITGFEQRAVNNYDKMREALEKIASQKRTNELETACDVEYADFEQGYDDIIAIARTILKEIDNG